MTSVILAFIYIFCLY